MDIFDGFYIPQTCKVNKTVFKKLFYENATLSNTDKDLFANSIEKITWAYCLKPETINIQSYIDETRDYSEIEIFLVQLAKDKGLNRLAEVIMKSIPYPMILIFGLENKFQIWSGHQRINLNDNSKNTIDEFVQTQWLNSEDQIFKNLDIRNMNQSNYFVLYSDIVDAISEYNAKLITGENTEISGEEARELVSKIANINQRIAALRFALKKETQFNRRMEINIEIKKLEQTRVNLIRRQNE